MQERDIVNDMIAGTKASLHCYNTAIVECSNQQLRNTFKQLRDEAEQMQYQLYQMAEQKGYYSPAPQANQNDVQSIKSTLSSVANNVSPSVNKNMMGNTNQPNMPLH